MTAALAPPAARPTRSTHPWVLALAGSLIAFAIFAWYITLGGHALTTFTPQINWYDAQAKALLAGHWNVDAGEMFLEGFRLHGKTYTYFGIWPSVLRMPILAVWPSWYGKLTRLSMLAAFAVYLAGLCALHVRIRNLWRPERPWSRGERALAFAVPLIGGCGTAALFLGSNAFGYHEAILWGAAWTIVAFERLIAFLLRPNGLRLAAASGATTLAITSRASVGTGATIALGLVASGFVLRAVAPSLPRLARPLRALDWLAGIPAPDGDATTSARAARRWILPSAAAMLAPVVVYCYVNASRFGSLYSVPWDRQVFALVSPSAAAALRGNGGSYFGLQYAPTTLLQFLRPDALGVDALFPWLSFQKFRTPILGNVQINGRTFVSSVTATMPALLVLTVVAGVVVWSRRSRENRALTTLRAPLIGATIGVAFVVLLAWVDQRYEGDWLPLLAVGGLAGLYALLDRREQARTARGRQFLSALLVLFAIVGVFQVWVNGSLAILFQRLYAPSDATLRAGMLGTQYDVDGLLGGGSRNATFVEGRLPARETGGTSAVIGNCEALYWSDGFSWHLVEGRPAGGVFDLRGDMPPADRRRHPLLSWARPDGTDVLTVTRASPHLFTVERLHVGADGTLKVLASSGPRRVPGSGAHTFEVTSLAPLDSATVRVDGSSAIARQGITDLPTSLPTVGATTASGIAPRYGAPLHQQRPDVSVCRRILDARDS